MKILTKIALAISTIGIIAFIANGLDSRLMSVHYRYHSDKIKEPLRAVVITDLHSNLYGENQSELMNQIHAQAPDVILLVGDIVDERLPQINAEQFLSQVAAQYPTYYVTGNHEYYTFRVPAIKKLVTSYGIKVLEGESTYFTSKGTTIQITGVDDPEGSPVALQLAKLQDAKEDTNQDAAKEDTNQNAKEDANQDVNTEVNVYRILLAHRPELIDTYRNFQYDLVLSGHAHGGQWRIPGLINGLYAPGQGLFPKYAGGEYLFDDTTLVVSRGIDTQYRPWVPRFYNRPEVVVLDLVPVEEKQSNSN